MCKVSKTPLTIFTCLASFALLIPAACALDKVAVTALVRTAGEAVGPAKGRGETQARVLDMTVTNRTRENLSGLVVKWSFLGNDLKDDDIVVADSGESTITLAPGRSEKVESKKVTFHFSRAGAEKSKGKGQGKGRGQMKRVPASGTRFAGWGVRVYQDGTRVGEAYSATQFKDAL